MPIIKYRLHVVETNSSSCHSIAIIPCQKDHFSARENGDFKASDILSTLPTGLKERVFTGLGMGVVKGVSYTGDYEALKRRYGYDGGDEVQFWIDILKNRNIRLYVLEYGNIREVLHHANPYDMAWFWRSHLESWGMAGFEPFIMALNGKPVHQSPNADDWMFWAEKVAVYMVLDSDDSIREAYSRYPIKNLDYDEFLEIIRVVYQSDDNPMMIKDLWML